MLQTRPRFGPVERRTLAEEIRQAIEDQIVSGLLPAGSRLPSERQLCDEFRVARTSVREAIQGLISLGHVTRHGNRAYVAEQLPDLSVQELDRTGRVRELFEVRRVIELPMIELTAERATDEQRARIATLAAEFSDTMSLQDFRDLDRAFHWSLAQGAHNALLLEVYGKVLAALFESDEWADILRELDPTAAKAIIVSSMDEHRCIADAVTRSEGVEALGAMATHLNTVEKRIVGQLARTA